MNAIEVRGEARNRKERRGEEIQLPAGEEVLLDVVVMVTGKSRRSCASSWMSGRQRAQGEKEQAASGETGGRERTGVAGGGNSIAQQVEVGARLHTRKVGP